MCHSQPSLSSQLNRAVCTCCLAVLQVREMARAVAQCHGMDVMLRDIKPENVSRLISAPDLFNTKPEDMPEDMPEDKPVAYESWAVSLPA